MLFIFVSRFTNNTNNMQNINIFLDEICEIIIYVYIYMFMRKTFIKIHLTLVNKKGNLNEENERHYEYP